MNELELAGCILLDKQGRVLLLHRNTKKYNHWEVPGGKVEPGESAIEAAVREAQEELGIAIAIERELGHASFVDGRPMHYRWFLATTSGEPGVREPQTFDDIGYFTASELQAGTLSLSEGAKCFAKLMEIGKVAL